MDGWRWYHLHCMILFVNIHKMKKKYNQIYVISLRWPTNFSVREREINNLVAGPACRPFMVLPGPLYRSSGMGWMGQVSSDTGILSWKMCWQYHRQQCISEFFENMSELRGNDSVQYHFQTKSRLCQKCVTYQKGSHIMGNSWEDHLNWT